MLGVASVFITWPAQAVIPEQQILEFEILRDGQPFGSHKLSFSEQQNLTRVLIDIEMRYTLGPFTVFRYEHSNEELWKGDRLVSLTSQTNDDGDQYAVNATWGDVLKVDANGERFEAPSDIYTTSYWNPVMLRQDQLLNTQKGEIEDVEVRFVGQEEFVTEQDVLKADHYKVNASLPLDVWYDSATKQWVGLKFTVRGSEIEYRRLTPID